MLRQRGERMHKVPVLEDRGSSRLSSLVPLSTSAAANGGELLGQPATKRRCEREEAQRGIP